MMRNSSFSLFARYYQAEKKTGYMEVKRNAYRIELENMKGRYYMGDLGIDGRIILQ
jgi:hypothetical protein